MKSLCTIGILMLSVGTLLAQQQPQPDPFAGNLFPPELIMQHQQSLGLSEEQKTFLRAELRKVQASFTERQWDLQDEMEKLTTLVKEPRVDEAKTLTQLDKVLALEREIKRLQFAMLIRIRNKLTPEQQARLREIASKATGS